MLGIGNILLSDEGVGVRAVEALRDRYEAAARTSSFIDGGTSAMELLDDLEGLDLLIVLDAVRAGREPGAHGAVARRRGAGVLPRAPVAAPGRSRRSARHARPARRRASRTTVVIGVEPASLAHPARSHRAGGGAGAGTGAGGNATNSRPTA
ncbi:MAG: hydrogenase maturation protease [Chromatiales bacterium]|nr:hydrogenase maturation protease [Chromatiales bacterium]